MTPDQVFLSLLVMFGVLLAWMFVRVTPSEFKWKDTE
jgi:hypothetical protein